MSAVRRIAKTIFSQEQAEGQGARVRRALGTAKLRNLDPFLMLDYFMVKKPAGFPDHPHRGFETVTYMLEGAFEHEDFKGHRGLIRSGDVQWMTAGRGIVHAEMPVGDQLNTGLQLWINLPRSEKMCEPNYQELAAADIPKLVLQDGKVRITAIAGVDQAKIYTKIPITYLDVAIDAGATYEHAVPKNYNLFSYVLSGSAAFEPGSKPAEAHSIVVFHHEEGASTLSVTAGSEGVRFALIGGEPIGEPVVQHGPFVMTESREIQAAVEDFYAFRNGFEAAKGFQSEIGKRAMR